MIFWALLGGFLAVAVVLTVIVLKVRDQVRAASQRLFGHGNFLLGFSQLNDLSNETPRSLSGCDSLLLPKILKDFPDFDANLAKTYVREYLEEKLGAHDGFTIYNVVIARYLPTGAQKTIFFQAAVSWKEKGKTQQKRYELHYTYLLRSADATVASNCPNCGGALGYGVTVCPYCDSRVANVLGNTWTFTEMKET